MMKETIADFQCLRCNYQWAWPVDNHDPCPGCGNDWYWNLAYPMDDLSRRTFKIETSL